MFGRETFIVRVAEDAMASSAGRSQGGSSGWAETRRRAPSVERASTRLTTSPVPSRSTKSSPAAGTVRASGNTSTETVYGLTSHTPDSADAQTLLTLNRGHWCIENAAHHCLDWSFDEDRCRIRTGSDRFPDCFVIPGYPSTEQTGKFPWGFRERKRETTDALEHGHEAVLDGIPPDLALAVLIRAVRHGLGMHDAEPVQSFLDFAGGHRGAVVGHQGPGQAALHERLAQSVDEDLGGLGQIPLQVAAEPGVVVEEAEQDGRLPLPGRRQHPALRMMEVPMRCYVEHLYTLCGGRRYVPVIP